MGRCGGPVCMRSSLRVRRQLEMRSAWMSRNHLFNRRITLTAGIIGACCTAAALAIVTFDGSLNFGAGEEWGNPRASSTQTNYTGFGDQHLGPGGFPGS